MHKNNEKWETTGILHTWGRWWWWACFRRHRKGRRSDKRPARSRHDSDQCQQQQQQHIRRHVAKSCSSSLRSVVLRFPSQRRKSPSHSVDSLLLNSSRVLPEWRTGWSARLYTDMHRGVTAMLWQLAPMPRMPRYGNKKLTAIKF